MFDDLWLIRTAVLDHPHSARPVRLPVDREAARQLRDVRFGVFWCGYKLGGCGRRLHARFGVVKMPHFAHGPAGSDESRCRRTNVGESGADHLYVSRALSNWLTKLGYEVAAPVFRGLETGRCTDMTIDVVGAQRIEIVFKGADLEEWVGRVLARSRTAGPVLFGPGIDPPRAVLKRFGFVIKVDLEVGVEEPGVQLSTVRPDFISAGRGLAVCEYREDGVWTPDRPMHTCAASGRVHPAALAETAEATASSTPDLPEAGRADRAAPPPLAGAGSREVTSRGFGDEGGRLFRFILEEPPSEERVIRADLVRALARLADDYLYDSRALPAGPDRQTLLRRHRLCSVLAREAESRARSRLRLPSDTWLLLDLRSLGVLATPRRPTVPPPPGIGARLFPVRPAMAMEEPRKP